MLLKRISYLGTKLSSTWDELFRQKYLGPFVLSNKSFIKFNSFINSEDSETFKEEFTSLYGVSSELLFPIFKKQINSSHFIYPKIMVAFNHRMAGSVVILSEVKKSFLLATYMLGKNTPAYLKVR